MKRKTADRQKLAGKENPPGITRTTLSYNPESMICHFIMKEGARIPLHNHPAVQHGYIVKGRVHFVQKDGPGFIATTGTSYVFDSMEEHGAEVLEESEVIEFFSPMRPEYADN
jgi:quercetin dioxygenase-like cupin family protein